MIRLTAPVGVIKTRSWCLTFVLHSCGMRIVVNMSCWLGNCRHSHASRSISMTTKKTLSGDKGLYVIWLKVPRQVNGLWVDSFLSKCNFKLNLLQRHTLTMLLQVMGCVLHLLFCSSYQAWKIKTSLFFTDDGWPIYSWDGWWHCFVEQELVLITSIT